MQDEYESTKPKQINPVSSDSSSQDNIEQENIASQNIQAEPETGVNQDASLSDNQEQIQSDPEEIPSQENDIEIEDVSGFTESNSVEIPPAESSEENPAVAEIEQTKEDSGWPHAEEVQKEPEVNKETIESIQEVTDTQNQSDQTKQLEAERLEAQQENEASVLTPTSETSIQSTEETTTPEASHTATEETAIPDTAPVETLHSAPPDSSTSPNEDLSDDEEILKFIEETKQKIYIVGSGGSGSNTLDRLFELGTTGTSLLAMNTDARHLLKIRANKKIIIGKKISRGRGAGSNPAIGEKAAKESADEIKSALDDASLVFITCGLGGGTGTGSAPVIAEIAKSMGALTVAVVTLPFLSEGKIRMENALEGLDRLKKHTDTLIVIKNDRLLNLVPDLPLNTAFKVCDEVLAGSVKGIAELVTKSGLVNVDFADLRTILSGAGFAAIGLGEASLDAKQEDRARVAVETALSSPLLDADISTSTRALINVIGGEDMTLKEAEFIVAETSRRINPHAHIIWGSRIEENIKKSSMRVLVVLAGVKFPKYEFKEKQAEVEDLDLDLIG